MVRAEPAGRWGSLCKVKGYCMCINDTSTLDVLKIVQ